MTSPIIFFEGIDTMKKFFAAILAAAMFMLCAAGCTGMAKSAVETGDEAASLKLNDYNNDFEGLCNYLSAHGYINPLKDNKDITYTDMDYALIGAINGGKFIEQTKKSANIEIYEFDTTKANATADEVIGSVKSNGTFSILELPKVNAYLSDNGKFMMIYNDKTVDESKTDSESYKLREEILEKFKKFHK